MKEFIEFLTSDSESEVEEKHPDGVVDSKEFSDQTDNSLIQDGDSDDDDNKNNGVDINGNDTTESEIIHNPSNDFVADKKVNSRSRKMEEKKKETLSQIRQLHTQ